MKVYYVYKGTDDYSSQVCEEIDLLELHDKVGIMPIIAPIVAEKQAELSEMKKSLANVKFVDKDTIFVEGITDKGYLEMAIATFSPLLHQKINDGLLQIVTREENGCGTSLLVDWAVAWMHLNYKCKAVVLLDADKEGKAAKKAIEGAKEKYKKKSFRLKPLLLKPTEDMKVANKKISNCIIITVEHLLSYDFWKKIKEKGWVEEKRKTEILDMFGNILDIKKSLDTVIDEIIENKDMKDTIIYLMPKDEKKDKILKLAQSEVESGNVSIIEGFRNTILELEKELG